MVKWILKTLARLWPHKRTDPFIEVRKEGSIVKVQAMGVRGLGLLVRYPKGSGIVHECDAVDGAHFLRLWKELGGPMQITWKDGV